MNCGIIFSILLHSVFLVALIFGLPSLYDKPLPEDIVMTVEILPISALSNVKPPKKKLEPSKPAPPKQAEKVEPKPQSPQPKPESKIEPKPILKVEPVKAENVVSIKPTVKPKPPKKPEPKPKPTAKKVEKKPEPKKPDLFASLEKDLQKKVEEKKKQDAFESLEESLTKKTTKTYDPTIPLSLSETDAIRQQFYECWTPPIGARDLENMFAVVHVMIEKDGTVRNVKLESNAHFVGNSFYQVFAESAVRAVHKCSPLKILPPADKFANWHEMELTFNPKDMF